MRYIRAFFKALTLTFQGRMIQSPAIKYPNLTAWIEQGLQLTGTVFETAGNQGFDQAARKSLTVTIDRRLWSAEVILEAVRYHLSMEYPSLLQSNLEHNLTTLYALNLDDQYRVERLAEAGDLPSALRQPIRMLADHLRQIPSSNQP